MLANFRRPASLLGAFLFAAPAFAASTLPHISSVKFTNAGDGTYSAQVTGTNFGSAPGGVPCTACYLTQAQVTNYAVNALSLLPVNVTAWSDTGVTITGIQASPGDEVTIGLFNQDADSPVAWAGHVSANKTAPKITNLSTSGAGADLIVTITGSGFGPAPAQVGQITNSPYFVLTDFGAPELLTGSYPWNAGFCGNNQCDGVNANYTSWSDTQIVISGFGGGYGTNGWVSSPQDEICVSVWNTTSATPGFGGSAGRCRRLPK